MAVGDMPRLNAALNQGLDAGLTVSDAKEILVQLYAYAGFPRSLNALGELMKVMEARRQRGIQDAPGREPGRPVPTGKELLALGTANQTKLSGAPVAGPLFEFAPAIDEYLKTHLFGDIFARDNLDWQSRELATVGALAAMPGVESQLQSHMRGQHERGPHRRAVASAGEVLGQRGEAEAARAGPRGTGPTTGPNVHAVNTAPVTESNTMQTTTLNNGITMPMLGLGVFQTPPDATAAAVEEALRVGYRLIDTAAAYGNEREVGEGIRRSGLARDVFIETKVWISDYGYDATLHAFDKSAGKLGVDQIDLLLLHQPLPAASTSRSTPTARSRNCWPTARCAPSASATSCPSTSTACWRETSVVPAVNQIEVHPYFQQTELQRVHAEHGILTQAWSPIGGITSYRGRREAARSTTRRAARSPRSTASRPRR